VTPPDPPAAQIEARKQPNVHALRDKVCSRKNLELAWEKVQTNRGRAGLDAVTMAACAERQEDYCDLRHRQRRAGTYQPKPVQRVEIAKSDGGIRKLGLPAVLDRVCQQALVQRRGPSCEPTFLASASG
jgi:retron-type reverse transcriptase